MRRYHHCVMLRPRCDLKIKKREGERADADTSTAGAGMKCDLRLPPAGIGEAWNNGMRAGYFPVQTVLFGSRFTSQSCSIRQAVDFIFCTRSEERRVWKEG